MSGALLSFSAMAVSVRVLAGALSVIEILAVRAGLGLLVMSAVAAMRPDLRAALRSRRCCRATRWSGRRCARSRR